MFGSENPQIVRLKCAFDLSVLKFKIWNFVKFERKNGFETWNVSTIPVFRSPQAPLNGIRFLCHDRVDFVNIQKKTQAIFKKIAAGVRVKCAFDLSVFFGSAKNRPVFELSVRST